MKPDKELLKKRDYELLAARTVAKCRSLNGEKLTWIRSFVLRASKHAPLSKIQINGLVSLLGYENAQKVLPAEYGDLL